MRPLYGQWLVTMSNYGHRQVGDQRSLHTQLHLGQSKCPWQLMTGLGTLLQWWSLSDPAEPTIGKTYKICAWGLPVPKILLFRVKIKKFRSSPYFIMKCMKVVGEGERKDTKPSGSRSQLLSRKNLFNLERTRKNTQWNPLLFIPEHFTVVKELIIQLLLVLLLTSFHRRQQLENEA